MTASLYREWTHLEQDLRSHEKEQDRIYAGDEYAEKNKHKFFDDALEFEMTNHFGDHLLSAAESIVEDKTECKSLQNLFKRSLGMSAFYVIRSHIVGAARVAAEERAFNMACDEFDEK